jgi:NADH-quinone oxidoreductase subunit H
MSQHSFTVPWAPRKPRRYTGVRGLIVAIARLAYTVFGPIVRRFPSACFFGAVLTVILAVWAHALLFQFAEDCVNSTKYDINRRDSGVLPLLGTEYPLTIAELKNGLAKPTAAKGAGLPSAVAGVLAYVVWIAQFEQARDLAAIAGIIGFISLVPMYTIWWERKVAGRIQSRLGPMRVGGWHGWSQSLADGIKLIGKEDLIPEGADKPLFILGPYIAFVSAICAFIALPFGTYWVFRGLDVALIFILAMMGVEVIGVILAGWASNNKWSVYGAMREACQMVSYEIPMGMALLIPIMCAGTLSLTGIADGQGAWAGQKDGWFSWLAFHNPFTFAACFTYYTASLANCKRAPFDLPESESELVAGFHTEYSGFRWSLFFFAEYASMFVVSGLAVILFLGGWHSPLPASWGASLPDNLIGRALEGVLISGPLWFIAKAGFLLYVQIWIRWTLPRIRIDQVLYACVQVMLPLTMVLLFCNTLWEIAVTQSPTFATLSGLLGYVLGLIGAVMVLGFIGIMLYGRLHRWRLVGKLGIKHFPGS